MADGHNRHELLVGVNVVEDSKFPDFQLLPSNRVVAQDLAAVRFGIRLIDKLRHNLIDN